MLQPKRTKFRKAHKGRIHGNAKGGTDLNFGAYGLKAMEPERITARQTELKRVQFNLRFQAATNQMEKPARVREVRRTIARIKTLQGERARAAVQA